MIAPVCVHSSYYPHFRFRAMIENGVLTSMWREWEKMHQFLFLSTFIFEKAWDRLGIVGFQASYSGDLWRLRERFVKSGANPDKVTGASLSLKHPFYSPKWRPLSLFPLIGFCRRCSPSHLTSQIPHPLCTPPLISPGNYSHIVFCKSSVLDISYFEHCPGI